MPVSGQQVLLDRDVAALYGVETKRVNEAVRNNPDKFPLGYMFQLNTDELESLRSKFSSANLSSMRHFGEALTDIVMPDLTTAETESSMEINFLCGKLKHTVCRVRKVGCDSCRDETKEERQGL